MYYWVLVFWFSQVFSPQAIPIHHLLINVNLNVKCGDSSRFNDIFHCYNMVQGVTGPIHILGHTLDVMFSPSDSSFILSGRVGDFISDHAVINCQLDFPCPAASIECYH